MKTNEQKEEKKTKSSKTRKVLLFSAGVLVGGAAVYLYTRPEARHKVVETGKKAWNGSKKAVTGLFKKKTVTVPCNEQPEGILVIRETVVPEVHTPKFENNNPRPRHRRENNWRPVGQENKLNVNK